MSVYHVTHGTSQTTDHDTFDQAKAEITVVAGPPLDTFTFVYDGETEVQSTPYSVHLGEANDTEWFTNYADDTPNYQVWPTKQGMLNHLKSIDNLARGILP